MNKAEFLSALENALTALRPEDRQQVLDYYAEMIEDGVENGMSEEAVIEQFDAPEQIAAQLCAEYGTLQNVSPARKRGAEQPWEYGPEGPVHTAAIRLHDVRVRVVPSPDGRLRVRFSPIEGEEVTTQEANGVFQFIHKPTLFSTNGWFVIFTGLREAVVELPQGFAGTVCVKTSNAGIHADDLTLEGELQLVTGNSSILVQRCQLETLRAKTSNSIISVTDVTGTVCETATKNAHITVERCAFDRLTGQTKNGSVRLSDAHSRRCDFITSNASMTVRAGRFTEGCEMRTSNGSIRVDALEAPDIVLETSNASIKGNVLGAEDDYAVTSHTSNANNLLRDTSGMNRPCRLRAVTSNGKIDICFTGKQA